MTQPDAGGPQAEGAASIAVGFNSGIISTGAGASNTIVQLADVPAPDRVDAPHRTPNLPAPAAGPFVGRDAAIADLAEKLTVGGGVIGQVVHGLGGVGKTELALQYAHQRQSEYRLVWWVSAETADLLTDGVAELARQLTSVPGLVDGYRWAVGWLQCHDGWLLVLDNVEDPAILRNLLGAVHGRGTVLVTTRRDLAAPVWARLGLSPLRLGVLDRSDSVKLLVELTGRVEEQAEAGLLAGELGDLPLALEQAGAFIAQEGWTIAAYRQELARRPGPTYATTAEGFDAQRAVDRVWALTMDRAAARAERARWVISILANLAPEPLPVVVLTADEEGSAAVEDAVRVLMSYSMLNRTGGMVEVHRLVQAVTRSHDSDQEQHRHTAALLLALAVPPDPSVNAAGWPMWNLLLPHIDTLNTDTPAEQRTAQLLLALFGAATFREGQGQLDRAIELFEQVAADAPRVLGADHSITLASRNELAHAYELAGRLAEAISLSEKTVADGARLLGADHPNTLASRSNQASAYLRAGQLARAIDLYEQVAADGARLLGADHPDTLASRNSLAYAYLRAEQLAKAIPLFEQVAADAPRVLGTDHPNTLASRNSLAYAYLTAHRLDEAIELLEPVAADRLRVLGADHPHTLASRNNLARAYQEAGRLTEAIPLFEQVAADRLRVLGADHPDTLTSRNNVAGAYRSAGRPNDAIPLLEQVAADSFRVLGADHPDTLATRSNLAFTYQEAGRLADAITLFGQVASDQLRILSADHPATLTTRHNLANAYRLAGRLTEAIPLLDQVAADRLRVLGADHPGTLNSLNTLAYAYWSAGLAEAVELFERVAADSLRVLGADHPTTVSVVQNLKNARTSLRQRTAAIENDDAASQPPQQGQ